MAGRRNQSAIGKELVRLQRAGKFDEAVAKAKAYECNSEVNKTSEHYPEFLCEYGACLLAKKQFSEAEARYKEAMARLPDDSVAYNGYAQVALQQAMDANQQGGKNNTESMFNEAEMRFRDAIQRFPSNPVARNGYARVAYERGDLKTATARYQVVLDVAPANAVALKGMERIRKIMGKDMPTLNENTAEIVSGFIDKKDFSGANDHLQKMITKDPSDPRNYALLAAVGAATPDEGLKLQLIRQAFSGFMGKCPPTKETLEFARDIINVLTGNPQVIRNMREQFTAAIGFVTEQNMLPEEELREFNKPFLNTVHTKIVEKLVAFAAIPPDGAIVASTDEPPFAPKTSKGR